MIRRPDLVEELENRYKREEYSKLTYEDKLGIFLELRAQARLLNPTYAAERCQQIQHKIETARAFREHDRLVNSKDE